MIRTRLLAAATAALVLTGTAAFAADAPLVGAPGVVPHPVESYLPITKDNNACIMCHRAQKGETRQKGEIPKSHYDAKGCLDGLRWECMLCHGQSSAAPAYPASDPNDSVR